MRNARRLDSRLGKDPRYLYICVQLGPRKQSQPFDEEIQPRPHRPMPYVETGR